ncbi:MULTISPECIES: glutathione S-transferase family protein [Rhodomicrobium]|uniref:glutathione S-transferase family protein n=1 Tax=Rhodomicrobium TaxID=1068 RepID=UPI000B4B102D|nr:MULTISPECIES: glutathione S-transferase family protein [Rhodomicrobium]
MGLLVDGVWHDKWYDTASTGGQFQRQKSSFRNWVTADGSPGPSGTGGFKAERGRYHLYVSLACPWAHRTLIFRVLKGLEEIVSVDVVHPLMLEEGWTFATDFPGATGDRVNGKDRLYEVYLKAKPDFTGRVTVPVLWDKQQETIVSNESSEIIRMFNGAFDGVGARAGDFCPPALREIIDTVNVRVYEDVNNGVYKAGFATLQPAYEKAYMALFAALDWLDDKLSRQLYLAGATPTEADWRLFTTLLRFDAVYYSHFKCNKRRIADYPNLSNYLRALYQSPGIRGTVNMDHIKHHYYGSHRQINPTGIIPLGPELNFDAPYDRTLATV